METFVDRIIETDRKARAIIDAAQQEKQRILREARKTAEETKARSEAALESGKKEIDAEFAARAEKADAGADADYMVAKHALDSAFEAGREEWLAQIVGNILAAE